jgi:hypothetical protein
MRSTPQLRSRFAEDPTKYGLIVSGLVLALILMSIEITWLTSRNEMRAAQTLSMPVARVATDLLPSAVEPEPVVVPTTEAALVLEPTTAAPAGSPPQVAPAPAPTTAPTTAAAVHKPATARAASALAVGRRDVSAFAGYGTWVDVFDWTMKYTKGNPKLSPASVDQMADQGVQTIFIQTARADWDGGGDIVEPALLNQWFARAKARNVRMVPWYLPTNENNDNDLRRLVASAALPGVTAIGVDIESKAVKDHDERSRRVVDLSIRLRAALPNTPIAGITLPNVVTDVMNPNYWPRFPWLSIAPVYDVWMPMSYWTNRKADSPYRNAEAYTKENIERLRGQLQLPNAIVSPAGGIGDQTTVADIEGFKRAIAATHSIGGSMYDWSTQKSDSYAPLRALRTKP